jgi:RNA polymerase-interacting CarD/CdnL/TRCF family regulator
MTKQNNPFGYMLWYFKTKLDSSDSSLASNERIKRQAILRLADVVMQITADVPEKEMTQDMRDALDDAKEFLNRNVRS